MTAQLAWLIDTSVVSEMMRPRPRDQIIDWSLAAPSRELAVVTRNTGEFRNTGVTTIDPWTARPR